MSPQPPGVSVDMGSVEIADFDTLMVETDVPEQRLHMVTIGGPAEIVLDAFPSRRYRGRTEEITPQVNRSKATVIVRERTIHAAGPRRAVSIPRGGTRIDGRGLTLLPGLIDCHVHLCLGAEPDVDLAPEDAAAHVIHAGPAVAGHVHPGTQRRRPSAHVRP